MIWETSEKSATHGKRDNDMAKKITTKKKTSTTTKKINTSSKNKTGTTTKSSPSRKKSGVKTEKKLKNMANDVAKQVRGKTDPWVDIPTRALSNVSFDKKKEIDRDGEKFAEA